MNPVEDLASAVAFTRKAGLTGKSRHVFIIMADYPSRPHCYASEDTIAKAAGYSVRTVRNAIRELESVGVVVQEFKQGSRHPKRYLQIPSPADFAGEDGSSPAKSARSPAKIARSPAKSAAEVSTRFSQGRLTTRANSEPKTALPNSWPLPKDFDRYARRLGMRKWEIDEQARRFWKYNRDKDHRHTQAGWFKVWKRWLAKDYGEAA